MITSVHVVEILDLLEFHGVSRWNVAITFDGMVEFHSQGLTREEIDSARDALVFYLASHFLVDKS